MRELKFWSDGEIKKYVTKTEGYWIHYKGEDFPRLDITTGYGAFILGYNNQEILDSIHNNYNVNFVRGNSGETIEEIEELAEKICSLGNWDVVAWSVSGSDAVETAIAMNDNYWNWTSNYRPKIISFYPGYNGTTLLGKHLRGEPLYKNLGRATVLESPQWIHTDDRHTAEEHTLSQVRKILENDINKEYGCLIFETSPWIDDMLPWSNNWWKQIRAICDEFGILFILDDVAICWGKHGTWFGNQPFGVQPDIICIGKALTGGYSPLSAAACTEKIGKILSARSWHHGHTWQPNIYGIRASLAVSKYVEDKNLLSNVPYINSELKKIGENYGMYSRGDFTFVIFDAPHYIGAQDLFEAGLSSGIPVRGSVSGQIKIASPLTADEEYFYNLNIRIGKLMNK
jgi:adenosylmethionine-8-amino-7-oxononanoate aminotransferase